MEKNKARIDLKLGEISQLILLPIGWVTYIWEIDNIGFITSAKILSIIFFGPSFGLLVEFIYGNITENGKYQRYSKYTPYFFLVGFFVGIPIILGIAVFWLFSAIWLNIITIHSLLSQWIGFLVFLLLTWIYKEFALDLIPKGLGK
jgi:hypothetical protein